MSRVGKYPVAVPSGVEITMKGNVVHAKGKKGELNYKFDDAYVSVSFDDGKIAVTPLSSSKEARTAWGTTRARINSIVKGVSEGFEKKLELVGVGFKARLQGKDLVLSLGFSHDVHFKAPEGITIACATPTQISISGANKETVGQAAAEIRAYRKPEPYKGKGVRLEGEYVRRKEGKKK
jgi:large subunit ribosomal protein L6